MRGVPCWVFRTPRLKPAPNEELIHMFGCGGWCCGTYEVCIMIARSLNSTWLTWFLHKDKFKQMCSSGMRPCPPMPSTNCSPSGMKCNEIFNSRTNRFPWKLAYGLVRQTIVAFPVEVEPILPVSVDSLRLLVRFRPGPKNRTGNHCESLALTPFWYTVDLNMKASIYEQQLATVFWHRTSATMCMQATNRIQALRLEIEAIAYGHSGSLVRSGNRTIRIPVRALHAFVQGYKGFF